MPTLADIYSAINTAKRKGADFVQNPGTSLQQMLGNANDRARALNEQDKAATDEFLASGQLNGPKQMQSAMDLAGAYNPVGMTVWHGSPYKFNQFDASKIGKGEGHQSYGHGLYVAENPATAESYKKALSDFDIKVNGQPFNPDDISHMAAMSVNQAGSKLLAIKSGKEAIKSLKSRNVDWAQNLAKQKQEEINYLQSTTKIPKYEEHSKGNLYKIDLPDEHIEQMLDWDSPVHQQPKNVQKALEKLGIKANKQEINQFDDALLSALTGGSTDLPKQPMVHTGQSVYKQLGTPQEVSAKLKELGIPGIKYFDEGSRGAADGTRNFVIFPGNEHLLNIQDINGQLLK